MPKVAVCTAHACQPAALSAVAQERDRRFQAIQQRAFEMFQKRGCHLGRDLDDWLSAEKEILGVTHSAAFEDMGDSYVLEMPLPDCEASDVQITATPGDIVVRAVIQHETVAEESKVKWTGFEWDNFYRQIPAPSPIDTGRTTASLDDGILRIVSPKAQRNSALPVPMAVYTKVRDALLAT